LKYKLITIVGARPQFIKAAAVSRAIRLHFRDLLEEKIIHTGQHYDSDMSDVFFEELQIPKPAFHLHIGSAGHGAQTGKMLEGLENLLLQEKPDLVLVYGDTNSTLAGAIAASKIGIAVVHVEAGLRSFNKAMPEEINRILTDHVSTLLFTPTEAGYKNLAREGFQLSRPEIVDANHPLVLHCGDVMYDNALFFKSLAKEKQLNWFESLGVDADQFFLTTIHRNANTDDPERLKSILEGIITASKKHNKTILWPIHPRAKKMLSLFAESDSFFSRIEENGIRIIPPCTYLQMVLLESLATLILTDSGGVQKEAYFYEKPCIVLRPETEWIELVESGAAILTDADKNKITNGVEKLLTEPYKAPAWFYGDGLASEFICREMVSLLTHSKP